MTEQSAVTLGLPQLRVLVVLAASLLLGACAAGESRQAAPSDAAATGTKVDVRAARPGTKFSDCPGCPSMVVVPPGKFTMGFDGGEPERYEGPVRAMRVERQFAAGEFEVTNAQFRAFIKDTGYVAATGCYALRGLVGTNYAPMPGKGWEDPGYGRPIKDQEPAACITWTDAKAYVDWLSRKAGRKYRLLSETEWEYVARAGRTGYFTWGDAPQQACEESNLFDQSAARALPGTDIQVAPCDDGFPGVAPVGSLKPNPFGLYDVIGNVWEWVEDCYTMPHTAAAPRDGSAQLTNGCDRRGSRGGSWISSLQRQRPAFRGRDPVERISQIFGLRVARD